MSTSLSWFVSKYLYLSFSTYLSWSLSVCQHLYLRPHCLVNRQDRRARRVESNNRERRRMHELNHAFQVRIFWGPDFFWIRIFRPGFFWVQLCRWSLSYMYREHFIGHLYSISRDHLYFTSQITKKYNTARCYRNWSCIDLDFHYSRLFLMKIVVFTSVDKSLKRCRHLLCKSFCFTFRFFFSLLVKFAKRKWFSFFPVGQEFIGIESLYLIKSKVIHLICTSNKNITLTYQQLKHRNYVCVTSHATLQHTSTCAWSILSPSLLLRNMKKTSVLLLLQYPTSSAAGRRFLTLGTFSWESSA